MQLWWKADELAAAGDTAGAAVWCRIIDAVDQLGNTTLPGRCIESGDLLLASFRLLARHRCYEPARPCSVDVADGRIPVCGRCRANRPHA
jgi:hypothetical protein